METKAEPTEQLQGVAQLFHEYINTVRSNPPGDSDKLAEEWLKKAKIDILKKIQTEYTDATSQGLSKLPDWVMDPNSELSIYTIRYMCYLDSYSDMFLKTIQQFVNNCGFHAQVARCRRFFTIDISFPEGVGAKQNLTLNVLAKKLDEANITQKGLVVAAKETERAEAPNTTKPRRPKTRRKRGKKPCN